MKTLWMALAAAVLVGSAVGARAETKWQENHPGRTEVNGRVKNQKRRVRNGVKDGDLSKKQARKINRQDRNIRKEEKRMAARDGNNGHLTQGQIQKLNKQENGVSNEIKNDEAANKAANGQ